MSSFTEPLVGTFDPNGRDFVLRKTFTYYTELKPAETVSEEVATVGEDGKLYITAREGFSTDFASVPRIFWSVVGPIGKHTKASVIHDWLYFHTAGSRKWADQVFLEAMKVSGTPWWKRRLCYRAVRLFGWAPWRRYKRNKVAKMEEPT